MRGEKQISVDFSHRPTNKRVKILKAHKNNLQNVTTKLNIGSFTVIT
ncbi:hypothetical protein IJM86_06700 [bacterium]|nr:hypothetical protein [bacterium]MCR5412211.1 hypothetical protein [Patescibacteria group bacterium]